MEKLIYALWKSDAESQEDFNHSLMGAARQRLAGLGLDRLKINITDARVAAAALYSPAVRPLPNALVSFWVNSSHVRRPYETVLEDIAPRIAGWSAVESTVLPNSEKVDDGVPTRGFSQIAFLTRLPQVPHEGFLSIWLDSHTQVGVETQDTFYYSQNIFLRALTAGVPAWSGIVEECYPIEALTNQHVYWKSGGSEALLQSNMKREIDSCERFLDMTQVNVLMTSEYRFGGWCDAERGWHQREEG